MNTATSHDDIARDVAAREGAGGGVRRARLEELLIGEAEPSLSDLWHKVGPTRPRLATHTQVTRQAFGPHVVYVVEDPAGGQFYRLSESAYFFLGLLDGRRTVDAAWDAASAQLGDLSPTQRECVDLLGKLQMFGLLAGDLPLAPEMVLERRRMATVQQVKRRTGKGMALTIPLVNPERVLEALSPLLRALFGRVGFAVWAVWVLVGLGFAVSNAGEFGGAFNRILAPANLLWMAALLVLLRAWHELGHACACKAMGGRCTEIGLMLIAYVLPFPYCDATSAWRFPSIRARVVVGAGGVIFELAAAALGAIVWSVTEPGLAKTLAFNTMVLSGVTTLVFNLNPLLRYDGYYILSDLTGTPNMYQRSAEMWRFVLEKFAYRVRSPRPPTLRSAREGGLLMVYGALSWPYRMLVSIALILFISTQYLTVGLVLAVVFGVMFLVWPVVKGLNYLATSPRLLGRRGHAAWVTAAAVGGVLLLLGAIPMPAAGFASGTLEPARREPVRALRDGFVEKVHAGVGDRVEEGQVLIELRSAEAASELARAEARLEEARAELDGRAFAKPAEREVALTRVRSAERDAEAARREVERLVVRAPISGRLTADGGDAGLRSLPGRAVRRGELFARVVSDDALHIVATLSDREHAYVFRGEPAAWTMVRAEARVRGAAGRAIPCRVLRVAPAAERTLSSAAAGAPAGGDVELDPTDAEGQRTLTPQFRVRVEPDAAAVREAGLRPGAFARVRLAAPAEPLLSQWWRRLRQNLSARWSA